MATGSVSESGRTAIGAVSVLLADERTAVRARTRYALERHGFAVVAEARDATAAVALALEYEPQVCLIEVDLPGGAIDAVEEIRSELPLTKIAMLTASQAQGDVVRSLCAGANGYLLKNAAPDRMSAALRALVRGEIVLPRSLTEALVVELRKQDVRRRLDAAGARRRFMPAFMERRAAARRAGVRP
jgi:DNA-binding NarL/FixJ family response regulator